MKSIIIYLLLTLALSIKSYAQRIIKCNNNTSFWFITDNTINYTVKLYGDISKSKMPDIINIEDKVLQYLILDKIHFVEKEGDHSDTAILSNYIAGETKYLADKFSKPFDVQMQIRTLPSGKPFLLWWYKLPEGSSEEVVAQVFTNVIIGDILFGLGSPQFIEDDLESIKIFLTSSITTLSIVKNEKSLCDQ
jgi:hypothetical protein